MEQNNSFIIEFLPIAVNDMAEIVSSFAMLGNKQGAIRIKNAMNKATEQASLFPYTGISVSDSKLAKYDFKIALAENYLMFYRIFEDENKVVFYRVLNGKRDYPTILKYYFDNNLF